MKGTVATEATRHEGGGKRRGGSNRDGSDGDGKLHDRIKFVDDWGDGL